MASFCRSPVINAVRSAAMRSKPVLQSAGPSRRPSLHPSRLSVLSVLGSVESLMPLHSAIASSRLRSNIGVDASFWSCLSQGRALPL